jgi:hypothetical protein
MSAASATSHQPLSAEEAEAVATAVALHHLRASQAAANAGPGPDRFSNWARESLLANMDKSPHRMTAWGLRTWG